jgi:intein/homing endonuclease
LINLDDLRGHSALSLLENYEGINPYILKLKHEYKKNKKLLLTDNQSKYIVQNHDREPQMINRVINITEYLGLELQKQDALSFVPQRILIEFILAETEKTFHVYGKLNRNQQSSKMYWLPKTQVTDDPYFEPINVDVDFTRYNDILAKQGKKLYQHQEEGVKFLLSRNGCILGDGMGMGKLEVTSNQVFTPNGRRKIGDLKVGDQIIGSNGKACNIIGVFPQGVKDLYKVTFNDGYSILVGKEHLWTVSSCNSGENSKTRENKYRTLSTEQMLDENLTLELKGTGRNGKKPYKFKTYYKQKNGNSKWQIPIVKPIEFENNDTLPIEPYLLGLALGDGHFTKSSAIAIQLHKDDFDELFEGILLTEHKTDGNKRKAYINNHNSDIKDLKLEHTRSETKFIPEIYKYSSIENRLAILQGLMDTDGHCMKSKNDNFNGTEYCTVSERLVDDVAEIVHSLGGIVRKKSKIGKYKKPDGTVVECRKAYRLNIKMPEQFNPFRLKRKAVEYNPPKKYKIGRYIKNIEPCGQGESVCIAVDAPDKLYVTEHAIVTHNTTQSIVAALESGAERILIVAPSSTKINWEREINVFCDDTAIIDGKKFNSAKFTIINFDILKNFHTLTDGKKKKEGEPEKVLIRDLANQKFDLAIIDEAHYLKNHESIRGKIMVDLSVNYNINRVWLLTGTPVANRPMDFFNLLKIIKSPIAENWKHFAVRYCDGRQFMRTLKNGQRKQIWLTDGASNLEELAAKTKNIILRRLKTDTLDMPDKVVTPMYHKLDLNGWKMYDLLWDEYMAKRKAEGKKSIESQKDLVELILLRKFIAMQAIPSTIEMVENAIEMGRKVIVFTSFTEELEVLANHFGKVSVKHNGPMTTKAKQKSVDDFQNNPKVKVFVGNIKSAGVGITLTEATVVIFNSFDWVTGNNEQAEDRCVFGGQLVMTNNGYKMIEDIKIGDLVYTHNGNFKKVVNTHTHLERKKTRVDIDAFGCNNKLSLTNDHKVYVYDNKDNEFKWVECGSLDINTHRMTLKSNNQPIKRKEYLDVINYVDTSFINNHGVKQKNARLKELPEKVVLTNDLLYAFGFFIAEGWAIDENVGKSASVNICQKIDNKKMHDASVYIVNIIKESFNLESHNEYIDKNNVKSCTIYSKNLAINFNNWFGKGVKNKQLPDWVDELNNEQLENLLEGFYHGDGYKRKNTQEAISASPKLGSQLIRYNANLGRGVSLKIVDGKYYDIEYTIDINNKLNRVYKIGDYITYPIKSLHISKPKRGEERVYDLSVEDDHSFIVGNYNVHNCFRIGQKNDVNVYYQLFMDTISVRMWETLKNKKDVIDTIMGDNKLTEEQITINLMDEIMNELND